MNRTPLLLTATLVIAWCVGGCRKGAPPPADTSETPAPASTESDVFALPRLISGAEYGMNATARLFAEGRFAEAEQVLLELVRKEPRIGTNQYNLACAQVQLGKLDAALASLRAAVENGFHNAQHIAADKDLAPLRDRPEMAEILKLAQDSKTSAPVKTAPFRIRDGIAEVGVGNTQLYSSLGVLYSSFEVDPNDPRKSVEAARGHGRAGALVRQWQEEGSAAGLLGVLYDNRDRRHSTIKRDEFPQLSFVEYSREAKREDMDHGLQVRLLFNLPTLGNSSTAQTGGNLWRSQGRIPLSAPGALALQMKQYFSNGLYVYPEHNDYDSGRNGRGGGWGDVFPARTPYCLITRGSSGSDLPMLRALALTTAAFRPETQKAVLDAQLLAPTLQTLLRRCYGPARTEAEYFTPRANPLAFDVTKLDPERMVRAAHAMTPQDVPPVVRLTVKEEDGQRPGIDYLDATPTDGLFDSPAAVARVWHRASRSWRMVVSAEGSLDTVQRPLTYRWVLLQGRPDLVEIVPLTPGASVVELRVKWHDRFVISEEDQLASNRIDVGVFAGNGRQWSAPAFVTFFCPDSVTRRYDDSGRLLSIEHRSEEKGGNYVDPLVHVPRDWRDDLQYDDSGQLIGWKRSWPGGKVDDFTADGLLVMEKDALGRPLRARDVRYVQQPANVLGVPLQMVVSNVDRRYEYVSDTDRRGRLVPLPKQ